jgi:hypothetical protein
MSKRLDENIGAVEYDGLIVGNVPVADVFTVKIRKQTSEAATLKRGTVLALSASGSAADGKMVILGTTATANEVLTANCILCDDVQVGTGADVTALAYRTGRFARNKLIVTASYTMTAADEQALREGGILLDDAVEY